MNVNKIIELCKENNFYELTKLLEEELLELKNKEPTRVFDDFPAVHLSLVNNAVLSLINDPIILPENASDDNKRSTLVSFLLEKLNSEINKEQNSRIIKCLHLINNFIKYHNSLADSQSKDLILIPNPGISYANNRYSFRETQSLITPTEDDDSCISECKLF